MIITAEEHEKRMKYYEAGLSDADIARRVYTTRAGIRYWRLLHDLSPNLTRGHKREKPIADWAVQYARY